MADYPAPRYLRLRKPKTVEEMMPKARELVNQTPGQFFFAAGKQINDFDDIAAKGDTKSDLFTLEQRMNQIDFLKVVGVIDGHDYPVFTLLVSYRYPVIIAHKRNFKAGQQLPGDR